MSARGRVIGRVSDGRLGGHFGLSTCPREDPKSQRRLDFIVALLSVVFALLVAASPGLAGTTGKISGRVIDRRGEPLGGANITVPAARTGAISDLDGRFVILNVPAGTYEVKIALLGYRATVVREVLVSADQTTSLDVTLDESPLPMEEEVVTAERPIVNLNLTSNLATVSRREIELLPVQEIQDIVNLQAGVVDGHFRGGRLGEVQFQVDGVTVNDPFTNQSGLRLDRSILEEVQVVSGTFDAEYGQAMSGVVNAVLKRGSDRFQWDAEGYLGDQVFWGQERIVKDDWRLGSFSNAVLNLSGPLGLPKTTFLASARYATSEGWVLGERRFVPTDSSDFANGVFRPTGDGKRLPLRYSRELSGVAKISNRSMGQTELSYQAIVVRTDARRGNFDFRFNPDGLPEQRTVSVVHGLDVTRTLSASSYLTLATRQNIVDYRDMVYEDLHDPRYDDAGAPAGSPNYELGAIVQGVDFGRFKQSTRAWVLKGSYVNQVSHDLQFKLGLEAQWPTLRFGVPGHLVFTNVGGQQTLVRRENEPPNFPGPREYRPLLTSGFGQSEVEWNDFRLRAGIRIDHFDARTFIPSDLANPANSISGAPRSVPQATRAKWSVAPRLGISHPVSAQAALFFSYGHFYQMPPLGDVFTNSDYGILADLQAGGISYGVLGNPDIAPERTVHYQFGYRQALADWLGLDVTAFYKDIRDLLGVEFVSTYNNAEYARMTNVDFGNVIGFTVALDQRRQGLLSSSIDYTWQLGQGNSSDPRETATRAEAGEDPRPREVPFNWDQRHTLNLAVYLSRPNVFTLSGVFRLASGQPYTPTIETGFGGGLEFNSGRKPSAVQLDMRMEKHVQIGTLEPLIFARVINAFDTRFFNGFVFSSTGSPYYSRDAAVDQATLADPGRFFGPRRIEVGIRFGGIRNGRGDS